MMLRRSLLLPLASFVLISNAMALAPERGRSVAPRADLGPRARQPHRHGVRRRRRDRPRAGEEHRPRADRRQGRSSSARRSICRVANDSERGLLGHRALADLRDRQLRLPLLHALDASTAATRSTTASSVTGGTARRSPSTAKILTMPGDARAEPRRRQNHLRPGRKALRDDRRPESRQRQRATSSGQRIDAHRRDPARQPVRHVRHVQPVLRRRLHRHARTRPINDIYAYGIRNSFGLAFDPLSGFLWDTENGPNRMDEINRVSRGFNSGWQDIMGPSIAQRRASTGTLVSMGPAAHYEDPNLSWVEPVAPTDAYFMEIRAPRPRVQARPVRRHGAGRRRDLPVRHEPEPQDARPVRRPAGRRRRRQHRGDLLAEQDDIVFGTGFGVVTDMIDRPGRDVRAVADERRDVPDHDRRDRPARCRDGDRRGPRAAAARADDRCWSRS